MSRKTSSGESKSQASQHAAGRGQSVYLSRRVRVAVYSIGVLFLLTRFLIGPSVLDIHLDLDGYSDAVDPDDIWDEVSQCCLVLLWEIRVQE